MRTFARGVGQGTEIVRLDQDKMYSLDHKKKTYTEMTFAEQRAQMEKAMQQMGEGSGEGEGEASESDPHMTQDRDPAGRPLNGLGGLDGRDVKIPEESDLQRSREILDELLRRAGERFRPDLERDYIDRLLKRF